MRIGQLLSTGLLAIVAAGLTYVAQRYDQLWLAVAALSGVFAGGGVLLHVRAGNLMREVDILREHLESTRQNAALLARHTRELRDTFLATNLEAGMMKPADFAALSTLVRDIADGVAELDRRTEAVEFEIAGIRRDPDATREMFARDAARHEMRRQDMRREEPPMRRQDMRQQETARTDVFADDEPRQEVRRQELSRAEPPQSARPRAGVPVEDIIRDDLPQPQSARPESEAGPTPPRLLRTGAGANEPSRAVRQLVAAAIAADRFDLYLQRVVGLPQRRVRAYDVSLRPDGADASTANADIRQAVEAVGHQLAFDRRLMIQAVRLARVFEQRERDVVLFADVSQRFLMSEAAFDELEALVSDVPSAARRIVLCLPQRFFRKAVAFEHEALRALTKMGFAFAMRDVEDFNFDPLRLEQIGVRWLRMPAGRFLTAAHQRETLLDVASADFTALLARRRILFVVDGVAEENEIAELLDLNVEYAQGNVFAPPQAVRADVFEAPAAAKEAPRPVEPPPERRSLRDLARRA